MVVGQHAPGWHQAKTEVGPCGLESPSEAHQKWEDYLDPLRVPKYPAARALARIGSVGVPNNIYHAKRGEVKCFL